MRWCPDGDFFCYFLRPVFLASRVQHVSDLDPEFAVRPHHVCKYGRHPLCDGWDWARKKKKKEETTGQKYNGLPYSTGRETCCNLQGCLKLPDGSQPLVGRSSPYCGDIWRRYCCLTSFFPIVDTCLSCEDIARQSCAMVPRWPFLATFLRPAFPVSRVQHLSDLHSKFALGPHHVSNYRRHSTCGRLD